MRGGLVMLLTMMAGAAGAARPAETGAAPPPVAALSGVQPGLWHLHEIGTTQPPRAMCVRDPAQLLQLRHAEQACARFVLSGDASNARVHYSCPGAGHGLTTIRVENPSLVRIQTQGIADGQPFDLDLEGRRSGPCGR
jgi:hypothetical protein